MYFGQSEQDKFVLKVLKEKTNGFFLEIGSNHPININNTYILEKTYNWKGIMVEYDRQFLPLYKQIRPNSYHIMNDATQLNYLEVLEKLNFPFNIDYLQIDLEVDNRSTLTTLEIFDNSVFDKYKFAVITFEHDIYNGDYYNTREISRQIFKKRGYKMVFHDIQFKNVPNIVYEDWYVHPDLIDNDYVDSLIIKNKLNYSKNNITNNSILYSDIAY